MSGSTSLMGAVIHTGNKSQPPRFLFRNEPTEEEEEVGGGGPPSSILRPSARSGSVKLAAWRSFPGWTRGEAELPAQRQTDAWS